MKATVILWFFKLWFLMFPPSKVAVHTWRKDFQKVLFTQALRNELRISLAQAKSLTDDVVANKRVVLPVPKDRAVAFVNKLEELGANAWLLSDGREAA